MPLTKVILVTWLCAALLQTARSAESNELEKASILQNAEDTGHWLIANSSKNEGGRSWPDDVLNPERTGYDLATGASGQVLLFVALHKASGDSKYREYAEQGGDYLLGLLQSADSFADNRRRASLYAGISGIGVALINLHEVSGQEKYAAGLARIVELLDEWSIVDEAGVHWSDEFNDLIYGEAGTTLFLSFVADKTGSEQALEMATSSARFLLGQAQPAEHGSYWYFRRGKEFNLPNFSHGTAGVGYVLASVASVTGVAEFAGGAGEAFAYLESIAEINDRSMRIPYGWGAESWDGLYEFGWAHGLAGTALFAERLIQTTIETDASSEMLLRLQHTLSDINLPGVPAAPFAEPSIPLDMRFGRAGVLSLISEWSRTNEGLAETRDAISSYIQAAAISGEQGTHWEVDAPSFMGGGRAAYTGYFHGAAGIGIALLKLHAVLADRKPYVILPDDPFSWPTPGTNQ